VNGMPSHGITRLYTRRSLIVKRVTLTCEKRRTRRLAARVLCGVWQRRDLRVLVGLVKEDSADARPGATKRAILGDRLLSRGMQRFDGSDTVKRRGEATARPETKEVTCVDENLAITLRCAKPCA
jgi:hypothetical protein